VPTLDSEEAARRLGVKLPTLYAYVSRGLLASHRAPDARRSLFDVDDVERLARRARGGRRVETRLATVVTAVTQLRPDGPAYRGVPAIELARRASCEEVAELLMASGPLDWSPVRLEPPPELPVAGLLSWAVVMAAAEDPLRSDLRPTSVARAAARLVATLVDVVPPADAPPAEVPPLVLDDGSMRHDSLAGRLAARLVPVASPELVHTVNTVLVLMADHELATSTVAVRVAASTRADVYDAVLAGLATIAGPLHGGASAAAYALLAEAGQYGAAHALNEALRQQGRLPGFGHAVYTDGDPRVAPMLDSFDRLADHDTRSLVHEVVALAAAHDVPDPNVDLVLAAICLAAGLTPDAGRTLFTIARVPGWVAHYLEELDERPLRFRARAVYAAGE